MYETPEKDRRVSATTGKSRNTNGPSKRESGGPGFKSASALTDLTSMSLTPSKKNSAKNYWTKEEVSR